MDRFINPKARCFLDGSAWVERSFGARERLRRCPLLPPTPPRPCPPAPQGGEPLPALPLHPLRVGERYYLALFLTGVYQEVMGSVHNM